MGRHLWSGHAGSRDSLVSSCLADKHTVIRQQDDVRMGYVKAEPVTNPGPGYLARGVDLGWHTENKVEAFGSYQFLKRTRWPDDL